jgi:hypothetical protein
MTVFRLCSTCQSRSQASLCHCTRASGRQVLHLAAERCANKRVRRPLADAPLISDQPELTISAPQLLFGRRPPQSNYPPYTVPGLDSETAIRPTHHLRSLLLEALAIQALFVSREDAIVPCLQLFHAFHRRLFLPELAI